MLVVQLISFWSLLIYVNNSQYAFYIYVYIIYKTNDDEMMMIFLRARWVRGDICIFPSLFVFAMRQGQMVDSARFLKWTGKGKDLLQKPV